MKRNSFKEGNFHVYSREINLQRIIRVLIIGEFLCYSQATLEHEVACLDVTPLQEGSGKAEIVAVGLWTDISARILRLPGLEEVNREFLGGGKL